MGEEIKILFSLSRRLCLSFVLESILLFPRLLLVSFYFYLHFVVLPHLSKFSSLALLPFVLLPSPFFFLFGSVHFIFWSVNSAFPILFTSLIFLRVEYGSFFYTLLPPPCVVWELCLYNKKPPRNTIAFVWDNLGFPVVFSLRIVTAYIYNAILFLLHCHTHSPLIISLTSFH